VGVDRDPPSVFDDQLPAMVEEAVVEPAEEGAVRGLGGAAVLTVVEVVDVAVPGRSRARRERAVPIPCGDGSALLR